MRVRVKGILYNALGQHPQGEVPRPIASTLPKNLWEMKTLGSHARHIELWVGLAVCVLTSVTSSVPWLPQVSSNPEVFYYTIMLEPLIVVLPEADPWTSSMSITEAHGPCEKCRISASIPDQKHQNLHFTNIPNRFQWTLKCERVTLIHWSQTVFLIYLVVYLLLVYFFSRVNSLRRGLCLPLYCCIRVLSHISTGSWQSIHIW